MSNTGQSAVVVVVDPDGYVLTLRRGPTDPWKPGYWNFPGGKVDSTDASVEAGGLRELYEEAGIALPLGSLSWLLSMRGGPRLVHVFWVQLPSRPAVHSNDGENDAYTWTLPQAIPQPVIPGLPSIVARLTGGPWNLAPNL